MSSTSKSAHISALVAQLKAGEITKQELFEKLQRLQHGEAVVAVPAGAAAAPPPALPASRQGASAADSRAQQVSYRAAQAWGADAPSCARRRPSRRSAAERTRALAPAALQRPHALTGSLSAPLLCSCCAGLHGSGA